MVDGNIKIDVVIRSLSELPKVKKEIEKLGNEVGKVKLLDTGIASLGNRLGFVAFQFSFLAGVSGKALNDITSAIQNVIGNTAKLQTEIDMALATFAVDLKRSGVSAGESIQFVNDAIRDLGGGLTMFNQAEVAQVFNEVAKAANLSGDAMTRARGNMLLTEAALTLMTIEGLNAKTAAIGLTKVMKQFNIPARSALKAVELLKTAADLSTADFEQLIRSLETAGSQARLFGINFEEALAAISVSTDILGGKRGDVGRALNQLLTDIGDALSDPKLKAIGVQLLDQKGQFIGIIPAVKEYNKAIERLAGGNLAAKIAIRKTLVQSSNGAKLLNALSEKIDDVEAAFKELKNSTGKLAMEQRALVESSPANAFKRLQNAVNSLSIDFLNGLSPAILEVVAALREIILDKNVQNFFFEFGRLLGQEVLPVLRGLIKPLKILLGAISKNESIMRDLVKVTVGFVSALTLLFIVGTVGALLFVMISGLGKLVTMLGLARLASLSFARTLMFFTVLAIIVFVVLKALDNIAASLKGGLDPDELGIFAFNAAIIALSAALAGLLLFPAQFATVFGRLGPTLAGLASRIIPKSIFDPAMREAAIASGAAYRGGLLEALSKLPASVGLILARLGTGGIIGLVLAIGAIIGVTLGLAISQAIKDAEDFGLNSAGELMMSNFIFWLANMKRGFRKWIEDVRQGLADAVDSFGVFIKNLQELKWDAVFEQFDNAIIQPMLKSISDVLRMLKLIPGVIIGDEDFITSQEAIRRIRAAIQEEIRRTPVFGDLLKVGVVPVGVVANLPGVNEVRQRAGINIDPLIEQVLKEFSFNSQAVSEVLLSAREKFLQQTRSASDLGLTMDQYRALMSDAKAQQEALSSVVNQNMLTMDNLNKGVDDVLKKSGIHGESIANGTVEINALTDSIKKNNLDVNKNSEVLIADTRALYDLGNDILDYNVVLDKTTIAFNKLAVEATELARRLTTFQLVGTIMVGTSPRGGPSFSGTLTAAMDARKTKTTFEDIPSLTSELSTRVSNIKQTIENANRGLQVKLTESLGVSSNVVNNGRPVTGTNTRTDLPSLQSIVDQLLRHRDKRQIVISGTTINVGIPSGGLDPDTAKALAEEILRQLAQGIGNISDLR